MKILIINVNCKNSSTGKIVYDLYTKINDSGNEAAVCYGRGKKITKHNIYKFGIDIETIFHALMTRITGWTAIYSFFSTKKLIKLIKKYKPNIVHIHELHAYFVNIAPVINYLVKNKVKTIWTFHSEFMYTGKCGLTMKCDKYQTLCYKCPQMRKYPISLFFDWTKQMYMQKRTLMLKFNDLKIVTPSKYLSNKLSNSFLNNYPKVVIHNGIDTDEIFNLQTCDSKSIINLKNNKKIVLSIGRDLMFDQKGGKIVLELAKRFINDSSVHFILIGVPKYLSRKFSNVTLIQSITNQKLLAQYYCAADAFVICSKNENFPTTCLEALACNTPIFGFNSGGAKETAPEPLGTFVKYGDLDALDNSLRKFLNSDSIEERKLQCRQYAETHYSKKAMFENYYNKCYKSNEYF